MQSRVYYGSAYNQRSDQGHRVRERQKLNERLHGSRKTGRGIEDTAQDEHGRHDQCEIERKELISLSLVRS